MSKTKDIAKILDCVIECGKTLVTSASALKDLCENLMTCGAALQTTATALKDFYSAVSVDEKKPALPDKTVPVPTQDVAKKYTLEEVRAILSAKSKGGFREQVREMILKRGVDNLTKLDPSEYPSLVKEVEGLTNA